MYKKCCLKCCRTPTLAVGHKADTKVFTTIFPLNVGFYRVLPDQHVTCFKFRLVVFLESWPSMARELCLPC